jgi:hypothetical protein
MDISFLVLMVVLLIVAAVFFWIISIIPNLPPIIKAIAQIVVVLFCLGVFLSNTGYIHMGGLHAR